MIPEYVQNEIRRLDRKGYTKREIITAMQLNWSIEHEQFYNKL